MSNKHFSFRELCRDGRTQARAGIIETPHGSIETPAFVPVGTQATVKSLSADDLVSLDVQLFFVNTYHAYLRPGTDVIEAFGGLHAFMNWSRPLITDSGGFQVFSLGAKRYVNAPLSESAVLHRERFTRKRSPDDANGQHVYSDDYRPVGELVRIDEDGVTFTSHWDGSEHRFTPERSIEIQRSLGADITICFDECTPYPTTRRYATAAMDRTHRWATRCYDHHNNGPTKKQALYGVIQGSVYEELRERSSTFISSLDFDGFAIGGVSVGETKKEMQQVLRWVVPHLPKEKPRHLLGVGEIDDIFSLVSMGVDTFDCVQPTRLARMGIVFVGPSPVGARTDRSHEHNIDITKSSFASDRESLMPGCMCYTCTHVSRAYVHHLFRVRELLAYRLATIHNLHFMQSLVCAIRNAIKEGTFLELREAWL